MSIIVYQSFELKQEKFKEGIENLHKMKKYRNENYSHNVDVLTPITGNDHVYVIIATYEGLAEMELQNKKMFDDDDYLKIVGEFFLENISQGSMHTQIFRVLNDNPESKNNDKK